MGKRDKYDLQTHWLRRSKKEMDDGSLVEKYAGLRFPGVVVTLTTSPKGAAKSEVHYYDISCRTIKEAVAAWRKLGSSPNRYRVRTSKKERIRIKDAKPANGKKPLKDNARAVRRNKGKRKDNKGTPRKAKR